MGRLLRKGQPRNPNASRVRKAAVAALVFGLCGAAEARAGCRALETSLARVGMREGGRRIRDQVLRQVRGAPLQGGPLLLEREFRASGAFAREEGVLRIAFVVVRRGVQSSALAFPEFIAGVFSASQEILRASPDLRSVSFEAHEVGEDTEIERLLLDLGFRRGAEAGVMIRLFPAPH